MTIEILATGNKIIGNGTKSIYKKIEDMISSAENDILIATYSISGNIKEILNIIETKLKIGVEVKIIINDIKEQSNEIQQYLEYLKNTYDFIQIINFREIFSNSDLHMKVIICDRKKALIGSANFTWKGLLDNYELGVYLEGKKADEIYQTISKIFNY